MGKADQHKDLSGDITGEKSSRVIIQSISVSSGAFQDSAAKVLVNPPQFPTLTQPSAIELKKDYEQMFDQQIKLLATRGYPGPILLILKDQKEELLEVMGGIEVGEGNIPFLPVIPRAYLSVYSQASSMRYQKKAGETRLRAHLLTDAIEAPKTPYFALDIEDGRSCLDLSARLAELYIRKMGRSCLSDVEVLSLCSHSNVLSHHWVIGAGSRYDADKVPYVYVVEGEGHPRLGWVRFVHQDAKKGIPSCAMRLWYKSD